MSMKFELQLTAEQAERLRAAIEGGALDAFGKADVRVEDADKRSQVWNARRYTIEQLGGIRTIKERMAAIYTAYEPFIRRQIRSKGVPEHDAEDLAQDVMLAIHPYLDYTKLSPEPDLLKWLQRVVEHRFRDWRYREKRRERVNGLRTELPIWKVDQPSSSEEAEDFQAQYNKLIESVRGRVSPESWAAFELVRMVGLSSKEVAAQLGTSVEAVRAACARVRSMLKESFEKGTGKASDDPAS